MARKITKTSIYTEIWIKRISIRTEKLISIHVPVLLAAALHKLVLFSLRYFFKIPRLLPLTGEILLILFPNSKHVLGVFNKYLVHKNTWNVSLNIVTFNERLCIQLLAFVFVGPK